MVKEMNSGSSDLGSSPGRGHCVVLFLKPITFIFEHIQVNERI